MFDSVEVVPQAQALMADNCKFKHLPHISTCAYNSSKTAILAITRLFSLCAIRFAICLFYSIADNKNDVFESEEERRNV